MCYRTVLSAFLLLACAFPAYSQSEDDKGKGWGFELGIRNTLNVFGDESLSPGFGGQFRIRPFDRLNTEWYLDYIKTDIDGLGYRQTVHIGWSVMFYPFKVPEGKRLEPYLLAGQCFDHAKVVPRKVSSDIQASSQKRWSSAIQLGLGTHFRMSERTDFSLSAQYMSHLGNEIEVEERSRNGVTYIEPVHRKKNLSLEGHLLITLSLNLKLVKR